MRYGSTKMNSESKDIGINMLTKTIPARIAYE